MFADPVRCETRRSNALNDRLREHTGFRVADLVAEFAVGIGATSKGIDRPERQGWVARQPNPADRRSPPLVPTDDGARLTDAAERSFTERVAKLIEDALDRAQTSAGAQILSLLRPALERDHIGMPTG